MHEIEDIEQENRRLSSRPSPSEAPPVLCAFDVSLSGAIEEYETRLRSVLSAALGLAVSESFDEDLPVNTIPEWFATVSGGTSVDIKEFAVRGAERYAATIGGGAWRLQEWLFQFDPESESRGWAWWDLTDSSDGNVRIWVDTWGESFFACDELRWAILTAGADEVHGPTLVRTTEWTAAISS